MEISSFSTLRYHNRIDHNNLRYSHSSYSPNNFVQRYRRGRRIHQRLIPLTEEILQEMTDSSQSNASISEKQSYNTVPLTTIVREEVQNILEEFVRKEEIGDLIDNVTIFQEKGDKSLVSAADCDGDLPSTKESETNKMIAENYRMLEQRVANLENLLKCMVQVIPMLRHMPPAKLKTHTDVIHVDERVVKGQKDVKIDKEIICPTEPIPQSINHDLEAGQPIEIPKTTYDEMYYESREYVLNLLNYKKSLATLELNKKTNLNPYIKPINVVLPECRLKPKQRSAFIVNNK